MTVLWEKRVSLHMCFALSQQQQQLLLLIANPGTEPSVASGGNILKLWDL